MPTNAAPSYWLSAKRASCVSIITVIALAVNLTFAQDPATLQKDSDAAAVKRVTAHHLPNLIQLNRTVFSGGLPEGDEAFKELQALGIRTIISVDGAKPDVKLAETYGLRYIHLPHGYDGISPQRGLEIAKAFTETEGPFYIHCHHGKHRSPAAAAVGCVIAGLLPAEESLAVLEIAGTSPHYLGLFAAVRKAKPVERQVLQELTVTFNSVSPIPPLAEVMVEMEHLQEHLTRIAKANWQSPNDHPDLIPSHEILLLREYYTEMLRMNEVQQKPAKFLEMTRQSEQDLIRLEKELQALAGQRPNEKVHAQINSIWKRVNDGCKQCHLLYRDTPVDSE